MRTEQTGCLRTPRVEKQSTLRFSEIDVRRDDDDRVSNAKVRNRALSPGGARLAI